MLASIATLVPDDPTRAQHLIWSLSDLPRTAIDSTAHRLIPHDQEMQIVGAYLHIQQERLSGRLTYAKDIAESAKGQSHPRSVSSIRSSPAPAGGPSTSPRVSPATSSLSKSAATGPALRPIH